MQFFKKHNLQLISLLVLALSATILYRCYETSDIILHIRFAKEYINNGILPPNFFYYWLISVLAFKNIAYLMYSSVIALTIFVFLKFYVIRFVLHDLLAKKDELFTNLISFALIFITSIYIPQLFLKRIYLGSFPSTIWLNSTTIAVVPFALLLFWITIKQINKFKWSRFVIILILILINLIIKPSFIFVYVVALPLTFIITKGFSGDLFKQLLPVIFSLVFLYIQKIMVYDTPGIYRESSIEISFMLAYKLWHEFGMTTLILFFISSIITSLAFPIYVLYKKGIRKNDIHLIFSWISTVSAFLIFIFISETGYRTKHGNFSWQIFISVFILFVVSAATSYKELTSLSWKPNKYQILLGLHLFFGLMYGFKIIILS